MASRLANPKRCDVTKPWFNQFNPTVATCDWHQEKYEGTPRSELISPLFSTSCWQARIHVPQYFQLISAHHGRCLLHTSPAHTGCGQRSPKTCSIGLQFIWVWISLCQRQLLTSIVLCANIKLVTPENNKTTETQDLSWSLPFAAHAAYPPDSLMFMFLAMLKGDP